MYCTYCGEELKHHEHIQDDLFSCPDCGITFEIYPKCIPEYEIDYDIIEGNYDFITEDTVVYI